MSELFQTFFWSKPDGDPMDMALGWLGWVAVFVWPLAAAAVMFGMK